MLKALARILALFVTVPAFELLGVVAIVVGVGVVAGFGWGLIVVGCLALLKAFDLAVEKGK